MESQKGRNSGCAVSAIVIIAVAYAASVVAWQILRLAAGDRFWWLAVANSLTLYLLLPGVIVWLLAWLSRRKVAIIAGAVPVAVLLWLYGGLFLPSLHSAPAGADRLRVMTFNVLGANTDAAPVERAIRAAAPDVVCLQELNTRMASELAVGLKADYPYYIASSAFGQPRVGVYSRFPLQDQGVIADPSARYGARVVTFDWKGRSVLLLSIHGTKFALFRSVQTGDPGLVEGAIQVREAQIGLWLDRVAIHNGPAVLCGDLNLTDQNEGYRLLAAQMQDVFRQAGWGLGHTFPAGFGPFQALSFPIPLLRVDYIWATRDWQVTRAYVSKWDGQSDHLPLVADLVLPTGPAQDGNMLWHISILRRALREPSN